MIFKVKTLWEGHKIWKNLAPILAKQLFLPSIVKASGRFFSNFMAYWENLNFILKYYWISDFCWYFLEFPKFLNQNFLRYSKLLDYVVQHQIIYNFFLLIILVKLDIFINNLDTVSMQCLLWFCHYIFFGSRKSKKILNYFLPIPLIQLWSSEKDSPQSESDSILKYWMK